MSTAILSALPSQSASPVIRYLAIREAAEIVGVSQARVGRLIDEGKLEWRWAFTGNHRLVAEPSAREAAELRFQRHKRAARRCGLSLSRRALYQLATAA